MKQRFEHIQALRGAAALMVLAAHIKGAELDYGGEGSLLPFALYLGVTGVDLFFLISGFVMAHVALDGARGPRAASRFLYNRAARIYPVYWTVTLALLGLYAGKEMLFAETTPFPNPLETFLLLPDDQFPLVPVGWTLVHELYFYIVFASFVLVGRLNIVVFLASWAAIVGAANLAGVTETNPWTKIAFSPLTFEFIAGALIAIALRRGARAFAAPALICGAPVVTGLSLAFAEMLYPDAVADFSRRVLIFGPPFALILYGAAALEAKTGARAPKWLTAAGDASYSLYLVHVPVFLVVGKSLSLVIPDGAFDNIALIAGYLAASLAAAFAVHFWIEKPALAFTKQVGDRLFQKPSGADAAVPISAP
jgi:exopolysaccharide production protein ExoZ